MTKYKKSLTPKQIAKMTDADIDFSDIAELDADFWKKAKIVVPEKPKEQLTLRLDADVVEWFKSQGKGYQTRINAVLRSFYEAQ
jgi:uncharacterized protein (DUF4415 family)